MKKEIILAVGSSSWWKNIKIRRESAFKLKVIRKKWKLRRKVLKKWKLRRKVLLMSKKNSIDTKIYKKYYLYK